MGKIAVRRIVTIFGYNTDIRHGDTVFHVQTEVRENELTMQSAIFVRGRCIGKHSVSYVAESQAPEFNEGYVHRLVTEQHRFVVNAIREGRLGTILGNEPQRASASVQTVALGAPNSQASDSPHRFEVNDSGAKPEELTLEWLPQGVVWGKDDVRVRFRVMLGKQFMAGARIISRMQCAGCEANFAEGTSDAQGESELVHRIGTASPSATAGCTVLLKVSAGHQSATRKFRLQRQ